jgi:hypothetical protein
MIQTLTRPDVVIKHMSVGEVALGFKNIWGIDLR